MVWDGDSASCLSSAWQPFNKGGSPHSKAQACSFWYKKLMENIQNNLYFWMNFKIKLLKKKQGKKHRLQLYGQL